MHFKSAERRARAASLAAAILPDLNAVNSILCT